MEQFNFDSNETKKNAEKIKQQIEEIDFVISQISMGLASPNLNEEEKDELKQALKEAKNEKRYLLNESTPDLDRDFLAPVEKTIFSNPKIWTDEKLDDEEWRLNNLLYKISQSRTTTQEEKDIQASELESRLIELLEEIKRRSQKN